VTSAPRSTGSDVEMRVTDGFAEIIVGDGRKSNALTSGGWRRVEHSVREAGDRDDVCGIVVRGREGSFCSGSDLTEWLDADLGHVEESFAAMESAFRAIERCPLPTIADIRGVAAGAGCQLALACDLRFVTESARIGMPVARLGILVSPSFAGRIVALAGPAVAAELLYTGRLFDAVTAVSTGLANRLVADNEMGAVVADLLRSIRRQPPNALRAAKHAVQASLAPIRVATDHRTGFAVSETDFHSGVRSVLGRGHVTSTHPARCD
jgi:enoyl-CoA hydratase/carnithine racemase